LTAGFSGAWGYECLSQATGGWSAPSTWLNCNATVPQPGDVAIIRSPNTVDIDGVPNIVSVVIQNGGVLQHVGTGLITFSSVTIQFSGLLTHVANATARNAVVNLKVLGDMLILPGGSIDVSGKGYEGATSNGGNGSGPAPGLYCGSGAPGTGGGGGHGGNGGNSGISGTGCSPTSGGGVYEPIDNPIDLGSGGGAGADVNNTGRRGGGAVILDVGGTLRVDGQVLANGQSGTQNTRVTGGAAGGSINITAKAIAASQNRTTTCGSDHPAK